MRELVSRAKSSHGLRAGKVSQALLEERRWQEVVERKAALI